MAEDNGANSVHGTEGTQPPAGTADVQGTQPDGNQSSQPEMTREQLDRKITELAADNAKYRERLRKFEAEIAAAEAAKLTDLERATKERDALAAQLTELQTGMSRLKVEQAVTTAAQRAGFVNPADAFAFIDPAAVEMGDDGVPRNVDALVAEVAKTRPYMTAATPPATPARPSGSFDTGSGSRSASREQQLASLRGRELLGAIRSRN